MKNLIKKILPKWLFRFLLNSREAIKNFESFFSSRGKLFSVFSLLLDNRNLNEVYSFKRGSYQYRVKRKHNKALLRRNIHRLEKGLSFKKLKPVFALRFIEETVDCLISLQLKDQESELLWSISVLNKYFEITRSNDDDYIKSKNKYYEFINKHTEYRDLLAYGPQDYTTRTKDLDKFQALESLASQRKSVRSYRNIKVRKEIIDNCLKVALNSPNSCNRQPFNYYLIQDKKIINKAASIPAGTAGWVHDIHNLFILIGDQSAFANTSNRHSIYVDASLSVMPLILAFEAEGISSCLINWADDLKLEQRMKKILKLKDHQKVILSIAFGYANDGIKTPYSRKKKTNEILKEVKN